MGLLDRAKTIATNVAHSGVFSPLITLDERSELEALLEKQLMAFYSEHGGRKLLEPGWFIVVSAARGTEITRSEAAPDELGRIPVSGLLSIRSLLASDSPQVVVTRNMIPNLATESTKALSQQINALAARAAPPPP